MTRKYYFEISNVILILHIFEETEDVRIRLPCGDVVSGNDGVSGARISVRCHIRNPQSGYVPLCRLSCIIFFLIRLRHLCDFRRGGGGLGSRRRISTVVLPLMFAIGSIFDAQNTRFRGNGTSDALRLSGLQYCRRRIIICFSYLCEISDYNSILLRAAYDNSFVILLL